MLISSSIINTYYMCTRTRNYKFHRRTDPLSSPHAKYVVTTLDLDPLERPTWGQRVRSNLWFWFSFSWRFLFGLQPPKRPAPPKEKKSKVLEMNIWDPTEMELELFSIYSPAHALLWLAMRSSNWLLSVLVMGVVGIQVSISVNFTISSAELPPVKCNNTLLYSLTQGQTNSGSRNYERIQ